MTSESQQQNNLFEDQEQAHFNNLSTIEQQQLKQSTSVNQAQNSQLPSGNSENIQVFLRMRPLNNREIVEEGAANVWKIVDKDTIALDSQIISQVSTNPSSNAAQKFSYAAATYNQLLGGSYSKAYQFNQCFDDFTSNDSVYQESCKDIVLSSLEGINGTIFMYGQTGAGKTFTMLGDYSNDILESIASQNFKKSHTQKSTERRSLGPGSISARNKTPLKGSFNYSSVSNQSNSNNMLGKNNNGSALTINANDTTAMTGSASGFDGMSSFGTGQQNSNRRNTPLKSGSFIQHSKSGSSRTYSNGQASSNQLAYSKTAVTPTHVKQASKNSFAKIPPLGAKQGQIQTKNLTLNQQLNQFTSSATSRNNFNMPLSSTQVPKRSHNNNKQSFQIEKSNTQDILHTPTNLNKVSSEKLIDILIEGNAIQHQDAINDDYNQYIQNETLEYQMEGGLRSARTLNLDGGQQKQRDEPQLKEESSINKGILFQSMNELFTQVKERNLTNVYVIRCSYFEIYNDNIYDLLNENMDSFHEQLQLNEDIKVQLFKIIQSQIQRKEFLVRGLKEIVVENFDDCLNLLRTGEVNRHYAETKMNHQSSRSHTLFRLNIDSFSKSDQFTTNKNVLTQSILVIQYMLLQIQQNFVDLAGSEKISNHAAHDSSGGSTVLHQTSSLAGGISRKSVSPLDFSSTQNYQMRVKEGQHINKSLFFLTQVIALKAEGKKDHIPYRNSPLTKILRSSLGGNSRTAIILCVTPSGHQLEQTFGTLRFGQNAKMIQNKVVTNIIQKENEQELKIMISEYEKRLINIEKDNQQSYSNLKTIIENLQKEKSDLNQRLIRANNNKLAQIIDEQNQKNNAQTAYDEHKLVSKSIYVWGCGILNTFQGIEKFISNSEAVQEQYKENFQKQEPIQYILQLNENYDQGTNKLFMISLRNAKKEMRELNQQNSESERLIQKLKDEQQNILNELSCTQENLQQQLVQNKMISDDYVNLQGKHDSLVETRYQMPGNMSELGEDKLIEIEALLYKGIQQINMEKGRREYQQQNISAQVQTSKQQQLGKSKKDFLTKHTPLKEKTNSMNQSNKKDRNQENILDSTYRERNSQIYSKLQESSDSILVHSQAPTNKKDKSNAMNNQSHKILTLNNNNMKYTNNKLVTEKTVLVDFIDSSEVSLINMWNQQTNGSQVEKGKLKGQGKRKYLDDTFDEQEELNDQFRRLSSSKSSLIKRKQEKTPEQMSKRNPKLFDNGDNSKTPQTYNHLKGSLNQLEYENFESYTNTKNQTYTDKVADRREEFNLENGRLVEKLKEIENMYGERNLNLNQSSSAANKLRLFSLGHQQYSDEKSGSHYQQSNRSQNPKNQLKHQGTIESNVVLQINDSRKATFQNVNAGKNRNQQLTNRL